MKDSSSPNDTPKPRKKLRKRPFFDSADRHEKLYGRSRLYASAQGRHETGGVLSLFSRLSFDISIQNSVQRWSSDFQGLFRVKIRKMAQGSNDLSTLPLIRFHCSKSCFLLETGIAGHERLFLAKWHPKAERKLRKRWFFDTDDRHEKLYGRSRLYASAQGRDETGGALSLFSSLSFDISIKKSMQRRSSDFQGLFRVNIRKMAQGSNDLSTLPLIPANTKWLMFSIRGFVHSLMKCFSRSKLEVFTAYRLSYLRN